jgi:phospholipase C
MSKHIKNFLFYRFGSLVEDILSITDQRIIQKKVIVPRYTFEHRVISFTEVSWFKSPVDHSSLPASQKLIAAIIVEKEPFLVKGSFFGKLT